MKMRELERLAEVRQLITTGEAKRRRSAADLSLSEVAAACGVDTSTVWRWEQGIRLPRGATALRYGQVLDLLANSRKSA